MINNQVVQIPIHLRCVEKLRSLFGWKAKATLHNAAGKYLGTVNNTTHRRSLFAITFLAAAALTGAASDTQDNRAALEAERNELDDTLSAIRPLVLQAHITHAQGGVASAVLINIERGILALSAHQAPVGSIIVLAPHVGHPVRGLFFEARIIRATNAPEANGQDAALAQILLDDPKNRQAYERYIHSIDGLRAPELPTIAPDRLNEESQYFMAGYAGGTGRLFMSRATPDFTDAPDVHLPDGLINECAYRMRVENLSVSQLGTSGGGLFEMRPDGHLTYHGIITAVLSEAPSRPLFFTPISVLNAALPQHDLPTAPRGQFASCTPKPLGAIMGRRR